MSKNFVETFEKNQHKTIFICKCWFVRYHYSAGINKKNLFFCPPDEIVEVSVKRPQLIF